jgi:hypothetical protein
LRPVSHEKNGGNQLQPSSKKIATSWIQGGQGFHAYRAAQNRSLPTFFIVGPPRTGTSWLHEILKRQVGLPIHLKETRFFDLHFHRGLSWYLSHYRIPHQDGQVGEVAPTYFASPPARCRIRELIPRAKIVCVFRDPIQRLQSLYRLKRAYGWISWSFEQAIQLDVELIESGRYATHLKGWQQDFGADHVLPTLFEDLREHPQSYVDQLADFIGIPRFTLSSADRQSIHASDVMTLPRSYYRTRTARLMAEWLEARRFGQVVAAARNSRLRKLVLGGGAAFSEFTPKLLLNLYELFRKEVDELEIMLQRDLSAWRPQAADLQYERVAA